MGLPYLRKSKPGLKYKPGVHGSSY